MFYARRHTVYNRPTGRFFHSRNAARNTGEIKAPAHPDTETRGLSSDKEKKM
jgi:hypothetical protein